MHSVSIPIFGGFDVWREKARILAGAAVDPALVQWWREGGQSALFGGSDNRPHTVVPVQLHVAKAFLDIAETVSCSADASCFGLLYQLLQRIQLDKGILDNPADPLVLRIAAIAKLVRRDIHKMKAFVRFKDTGIAENGRRCFAAWFEPDNYIVERAAPFFARRFADMDWVIMTPKGHARFTNGDLTFGPFEGRPPDITDNMDDLWRAYFANIFNPARLKVKAMQSEMPKKYWKNLPEAMLIPDLIASAEKRAREMRDKLPTAAPAHLLKFKAETVTREQDLGAYNSMDALNRAARTCERCALFTNATQTVAGEGPTTAGIMLVGEQPGDQEDLQGRPFVGPAGQLLMDALAKANISRDDVYTTNAVKHFKFTPRGKRRIHQRPNAGEIQKCKWWLSHELSLIQPRLVVALGATALQSLTGTGEGVMKRRGTFEVLPDGTPLLVTYHPSAILRAPTEEIKSRMRDEFEQDLARISDAAKSSICLQN